MHRPTQTQIAAFRSMMTIGDVATLFGTTPRRLQHLLFGSPAPYRSFGIPKASGGTRIIEAPPRTIGVMQRLVADCISAIYTPARCVHGFAETRSIATNARSHVDRRLVLNIDLEDFFGTIHFGRVLGIFHNHPFRFPTSVATILSQLCCYRGRLPQGAPSSPVLSNLACRTLDRQLYQLARTHGCRYTRYADDITFSTESNDFPAAIVRNPFSSPPELGDLLSSVVQSNSFKINAGKVRLRSRRQRQEVTGLTVNKRANLRRDVIREIRGALHSWETLGEAEADKRFQTQFAAQSRRQPPAPLRSFLRGRLAFLKMVRSPSTPRGNLVEDRVCARYLIQFAQLAADRSIPVAGPAALMAYALTRALWIVVGEDSFGIEIFTGSAFSLRGHGIITSAHVLEAEGVAKWVLRPAWSPGREYPITIFRSADHFDLAQIPPPIESPATLSVSTSIDTVHGSPICIAGFPKWGGAADRVRIEKAHVTGIKVASTVKHVITSGNLLPGNSGGPLLDDRGMVIGVARYDSTSLIAPNSGVSIEHLTELSTHGRIRVLPHRRAEL